MWDPWVFPIFARNMGPKNGSYRAKKKETTAKPKNQEIWSVGVVGNNSRMDCPRVSRDLVLQNIKNISFLFISSIFQWGVQQKVACLFISPGNKFQDHSHQNRLNKLVPLKDLSKQGSEIHKNNKSNTFRNLIF